MSDSDANFWNLGMVGSNNIAVPFLLQARNAFWRWAALSQPQRVALACFASQRLAVTLFCLLQLTSGLFRMQISERFTLLQRPE